MKNKIFLTVIFAAAFTGCAKFTDIQPKGRNLLRTAEDIEMVLNYSYGGYSTLRHTSLTNAMLPYSMNVTTLVDQDPKTVAYAWAFWDEDVDRKALNTDANNGAIYTEVYKIVNTVCNPVLSHADEASGSRTIRERCKAEAYVLRAWFHYLAVNFYAKAYDPATAATDGGVPYVLHTDVMSQPLKKYTVAEVYDFILADLDAALKLNALPNDNVNRQRVNLAFAYAVQAKVLMSMHNWDDALTAARNSLAITDHVDDHNTMLTTSTYSGLVHMTRPQLTSGEDLLYTQTSLSGIIISAEMLATFDPDAVFVARMPNDVNMYGTSYSPSYAPGLPYLIATSATVYTLSGCGLTTVDMHLTEAECLLRDGQTSPAKQKLEMIRRNRIITDRYTPSTASTKTEVFALLKQLLRSDNFYTVKDFIDLKRWNTEPEYAATMHRSIAGKECTLSPDSDLWIFPFPESATRFNANLTHNY